MFTRSFRQRKPRKRSSHACERCWWASVNPSPNTVPMITKVAINPNASLKTIFRSPRVRRMMNMGTYPPLFLDPTRSPRKRSRASRASNTAAPIATKHTNRSELCLRDRLIAAAARKLLIPRSWAHAMRGITTFSTRLTDENLCAK